MTKVWRAKLPQVASLSTAVLYQVVLPNATHAYDYQVTAMSSPDHGIGVTTDKVKILQGKLFDPHVAGQAMVDSQLASLEHLKPGDTLRLLGVPNNGSGATEPTALLSSFPVPNAATTMSEGDEAAVRPRPGAGETGFIRAATALAKRYRDTGGQLVTESLDSQVAATEAAISPQAITLATFAGLTGLMPIGPARLAEPHPGTEVNLAILGTGFAAVALLPIALLAGAAVFGTSLVVLLSTPRAYGQNWDAQLDLGFGGVPGSIGAKVIKAESAVTGYAPGNYGQLTIDGQIVPSIGIGQPRDAGSGGGYLTITAGRAPATPDEIALGAQTMRAVHASLGQPIWVEASLLSGQVVRREMRVVGVVVLPDFGRGTLTPTGLGTGAVTTASVTSTQSVPDATTLCFNKNATCYNFFLVRLRPGTDLSAAAATLTSAITKVGCPPGSCAVTTDQRPTDITAYASVRDTPVVLAAALILFAVTIDVLPVLLAIPATLLIANLIAAWPGWAAARLRPALVLRSE